MVTGREIEALLREFSEKPIAYQRIYSKITGSITSGILLSQLVYWHYAMKGREFHKTNNDFCDELGMGIDEFKRAKKKLCGLKVIKVNRKGIPAKTHYLVNINQIIFFITSCVETSPPVSRKPTNLLAGNQLTNTENTTENTPEKKESTKESPVELLFEDSPGVSVSKKTRPTHYKQSDNSKKKKTTHAKKSPTKKRIAVPLTNVATKQTCELAFDLLNKLTKSNFNSKKHYNRKLISSLLDEDFTEVDVLAVIKSKFAEWGGDRKMKKHLTPHTLFGEKFEGYLQNARTETKTGIWDNGLAITSKGTFARGKFTKHEEKK